MFSFTTGKFLPIICTSGNTANVNSLLCESPYSSLHSEMKVTLLSFVTPGSSWFTPVSIYVACYVLVISMCGLYQLLVASLQLKRLHSLLFLQCHFSKMGTSTANSTWCEQYGTPRCRLSCYSAEKKIKPFFSFISFSYSNRVYF